MRREPAGKECGFSIVELLTALTIALVIAVVTIPEAASALQSYRLHADASAIASEMNVARMKAASQDAPYRLVINISDGTYWTEKLCGLTSSSVDSACTSAYSAFTDPQIESGTQYAMAGDAYSSCRPSSITGSLYPGTIQGDPSTCADPLYVYFNTRGSPVDSSGNPLGNGGAVLYVKNLNGLADAVTVSVGGAVATWNWDTVSASWTKR